MFISLQESNVKQNVYTLKRRNSMDLKILDFS